MEEQYMVIQLDGEYVVGELDSGPVSAGHKGAIPAGDYVLKKAIRVKEITTPSMSNLGRVSASTMPALLPFLPTIVIEDTLEVTVPVTDKHWRCLISKELYDKFRASFKKGGDPEIIPTVGMPGKGPLAP